MACAPVEQQGSRRLVMVNGVAEWTELDGLTPSQLDTLPFGVILVDGAGKILAYNQAESRFSGRSPERVIGRNFFRDVAPCTHLPAFHGRFLDGVRNGDLDVVFGFVFGFDQPARVQVRLRASATPDHYWIVVHQLGLLEPSRHRLAARAAQDTVDRRRRAEPVDSDICEREPIHVPAAVQPHAAMLAFDPVTLKAMVCSNNVEDSTGLSGADVLGRSLAELLPPIVAEPLMEAVASGALARSPSQPWRRVARLGPEQRQFALTAHLHDGRVIVEAEMLPERPEDFGAATAEQAKDAVRTLRRAETLGEAAKACAEQIRQMTGFQRVLVYRFDEEWNGEALGESRDDTYPSLLGLRFPASDIPAQARALYVHAPARFVVDRDAVPAAVLAEPAAGNRPVDLSFAYSRALSPIHLEYQRNLGVNGSMSVSIVVEGRLWGLVIGHHNKPHYVTPETRGLTELVTDAFALRVHELATTLAWREQQQVLQQQNALLRHLASSDDYVATLASPQKDGSSLLHLFGATPGAAVIDGDRIATLGSTPPEGGLAAFANWLRTSLPPEQRVFATADLSEHWPEAAEWHAVAAGVLAVFVDAERRDLLLWFRPEIASTVAWGGDPNTPVLADTATGTVLPRRSFERWVEERRGQAEPWAAWQVDSAAAFASAVGEVAIRQGRKIAEMSAKQDDLSQALAQKDLLAREIDHRVKNSLQIVAGVLLMQSRQVTDEEAKGALRDTYARVMSIARVHDSLQQSSGAQTVDLGQSLQQLCADLTGGMAGDGRSVEVEADAGLMVPSEVAVALSLIATELVTNAIKYAYAEGEDGSVRLSLRTREASGLAMTVCDEGQGLAPDWRTRDHGGGLGMRVINALVQQIGGEIDVDLERDKGTCFIITA